MEDLKVAIEAGSDSIENIFGEMIFHTLIIPVDELNLENIGEMMRKGSPYVVNILSGVEENPHIKDHKKIFDFIARERRTHQ